MKNIKIDRLQKVENKETGESFQLVEITIDYFGVKSTNTYDTRFTKCGKQLIIDGDGFIPDNYDITSL